MRSTFSIPIDASIPIIPAEISKAESKQIREMAIAIRAAVRRPPPDDPREAITGAHQELSNEDETRVEAALLELLTASRRDPQSGDAGSAGDRR